MLVAAMNAYGLVPGALGLLRPLAADLLLAALVGVPLGTLLAILLAMGATRPEPPPLPPAPRRYRDDDRRTQRQIEDARWAGRA